MMQVSSSPLHVSNANSVTYCFADPKDREGRFKENNLWGNGWGWALFKGDAPMTQAATDYVSDCRDCHVPAKENDWVFIQCYPLLKKQPEESSDKKAE